MWYTRNIAIVFAGWVGKRMWNNDLPKQFMHIGDKPIIIHTLEVFEHNENIDWIIISCVADWIDYLKELIVSYNIKKIKDIVPWGETGQMSIFNGLKRAYKLFDKDSIVLIHDGVRPFIDNELINTNISNAREKWSSISSVLATETFVIIDEDKNILNIPERKNSLIAKAPQTFILDDIYNVHLQAQKDWIFDSIDSCTLMNKYNKKLSVVMTDYDNIKITTPKDISLAESIYIRKWEDKNV